MIAFLLNSNLSSSFFELINTPFLIVANHVSKASAYSGFLYSFLNLSTVNLNEKGILSAPDGFDLSSLTEFNLD